MAVYKRSYSAYEGGHTLAAQRFFVLTRYGWSELFKSRIFTTFYVAIALIPFLIGAFYIYIANTPAVQELVQAQGFLQVNRMWFLGWLQVQGWFSLLLSAWVGPSLVSPDLTNGALPLFLSRPLSRTQYVLGKSLVLAVLISIISWIPALLLFALQVSLGPSGWGAQNFSLIPAIIVSTLLWTAFLCALSLALSAWVRWRVVATGLTFAVFFLPAGFGTALNVARVACFIIETVEAVKGYATPAHQFSDRRRLIPKNAPGRITLSAHVVRSMGGLSAIRNLEP